MRIPNIAVTASVLLALLITFPASGAENSTVRLEGEVVDAETGMATPCRIYVEGPPGTLYHVRTDKPDGSAVHYSKQRPGSSETHTTISAHPFVADLAPGEYTLTAERGKEYFSSSLKVRLRDKPVKVSIKLRRWIDMASRGWYSGDTHVHRSLSELPNIVLAEDLNLAFPLGYWVRAAFEPPAKGDQADLAETAAKTVRVDATHLIWPRNTEYELFTVGGESHTLGAFFVIGHRTVFETGAPPVAPIAKRAHADNALIELDKHAWPWSMAIVPIMDVDLYELTNNHIWRSEFSFTGWGEPAAPYMDIERDESGWTEWGWIDYGFKNYYALLNCGFRLRPTAGTASGVHPVPLGFGRVYVKVEGELSVDSWLKGLDEGHSFVTTGPMLSVRVEGSRPGGTLRRQAPANITVQTEVYSELPLDRIEIIRNGEIEHVLQPQNEQTPGGARHSRVEADVRMEGSGWIAVRAYEKTPEGRIRFAHSSPVHIDVEGKPLRPRREEVEFLMERVRAQIVRSRDVLPASAIQEYENALQTYEEILTRAKP